MARSAATLALCMVGTAVAADPPPNERTQILGRSMKCGEYEFRFFKAGAVTVFVNGKRSSWSTQAKYVHFLRNEIEIAPRGAQDTIQISYKFGKYGLDRNGTSCVFV